MMKMIRFRCGKAVPSINNGMDKAVAKETTPRIPAQPITNGPFQPGDGSFLILALNHLGTKAAG